MKRLIVACGSGVATSTTIAEKIKSLLENEGVDYNVEAVDYKSIMSELPTASIYVYIAQPDQEVLDKAEELNIPVFAGIPFLTGMGADSIFNEILDVINQ